ncbi:hypothetical protein SAMN05443094_10597 [Domibacillus enclensis]|uniref:Uncharacterized protein n=2 Tax=Domibacillus enclensis TaxID=1017273 RepID=A0A1N6XZ01_9BACI|nr:hypothetical protein SAMN05443094_10597 [Domibacillus enclensis]
MSMSKGEDVHSNKSEKRKNGLLTLLLGVLSLLIVLFIFDSTLVFRKGWLVTGWVSGSLVVALTALFPLKKQPARTLILAIGILAAGTSLLIAMFAFYGFAKVMGG